MPFLGSIKNLLFKGWLIEAVLIIIITGLCTVAITVGTDMIFSSTGGRFIWTSSNTEDSLSQNREISTIQGTLDKYYQSLPTSSMLPESSIKPKTYSNNTTGSTNNNSKQSSSAGLSPSSSNQSSQNNTSGGASSQVGNQTTTTAPTATSSNQPTSAPAPSPTNAPSPTAQPSGCFVLVSGAKYNMSPMLGSQVTDPNTGKTKTHQSPSQIACGTFSSPADNTSVYLSKHTGMGCANRLAPYIVTPPAPKDPTC